MYSQSNEEEVILKYFNNRKGTFLDCGSNDGITLSNTRALAEMGWKGVFVEPSPEAFRRLKANYKGKEGFYFYNFALGTSNGEVDFWDMGAHLGDDHGLLSTMRESETERWKGTEFTKIKVKSFRWKTFLNRLSIKSFDFISIDAEGEDAEILKQIDLRGVQMVCVEWNSKDENEYIFTKLMEGFNLIYRSGENLIFAR